jgi:hypothetical protein
MVVLTAGVAVVTSALPGLPTTTVGAVPGVVVVVVVITERTGSGGGGAQTTCDSGSVAQPARSPSVPQVIRMVVSRAVVRTGVELESNVTFLFSFFHNTFESVSTPWGVIL